jgi:hypothetical protein
MVDQVGGVNPLGNGGQGRRVRRAYLGETGKARAGDQVKMSGDLERLKKIPGIRLEKVLEVRKALAEGSYISDEKLDLALERAIDEAFGGGEESRR